MSKISIEPDAAQTRFLPRPKFEYVASARSIDVDPVIGQAMYALGGAVLVDNVDRAIAIGLPLLHEGKHHRVFVGRCSKECAKVTAAIHGYGSQSYPPFFLSHPPPYQTANS
jgi:hypothetical protein